MIRRAVPNLLMIVLTLCALEACTKDTRLSTLQASITSVTAARDGFVIYDRVHQQDLLDTSATREQFTVVITAYRKEREMILNTFEVVYRALAVAATQTDGPSLNAALAQAGELVTAIHKLTGAP